MVENRFAQDSAFALGTATDEPVLPINPQREAAVTLPAAETGAGDPVPADSRFATMRADEVYWAGVSHGIRAAGREPAHPHMPCDFSLDLVRAAGDGALVSGKMLDPWPYDGGDEASLGNTMYGPFAGAKAEGGSPLSEPAAQASLKPRAPRSDGLTPDRQQLFLDALAVTGVVADACRVAGISREAVYSLRKRAEGAAFALAWDAAILIARRAVADDVMSRARHGVIDRVYRNGELVAERHRYDNRLTMSVLTRLDRQAEGLGEGAATARLIAGEWEQFSRIVAAGGEGAEEFLRSRTDPPLASQGRRTATRSGSVEGSGQHAPVQAQDIESTASLLARLAAFRKYEAGLAHEVRTCDLDPAQMPCWTPEQWARAKFSGLLGRLAPGQWPDCGCAEGGQGADGKCQICQLKPAEPEPELQAAAERKDDFEGCGIWEDAQGEWLTDFPPPAGFDGYEEGEPATEDYQRVLSEEELVVIGADEESQAEERAELLAAQHAARERFFGFAPAAPAPQKESRL